MNKKGNLKEVVVYVLLALVMMSVMYISIVRIGEQSSFYEQLYSKKIALMIDKAKPGMEINYDVSDFYRRARGFNGKIVEIDNEENNVVVRLTEGKGYGFDYFNNVDVVWSLDAEDRILKMEIVEKNFGGGRDV